MKYLCLVYHDAPPTNAACVAETCAYDTELQQRGHVLAAHALEDARATAIVRVRDGRLRIDDGACATTQAHLGGYYLIEARDLNEAIRLAASHPAARQGSIAVHPVRDCPPR